MTNQLELFSRETRLKDRSEDLENILSDPDICIKIDNGDSEEIIESEIEMILFNINHSNSDYEKARLYKELHNRLTMV
tara:strand:+ start:819 stop:1052 length:234 start_codon:yes stop_codon:yes gene_type:complete